MKTFNADLKEELNMLTKPFGWEYRLKDELFIIESDNHDIHHENIEDFTKELENNIGGTYAIDEAYEHQAVVIYNSETAKSEDHTKPTDTAPANLPTLQEQADLFGATDWEYKGQYVDFYVGGVFVGSSNMNYLRIKTN